MTDVVVAAVVVVAMAVIVVAVAVVMIAVVVVVVVVVEKEYGVSPQDGLFLDELDDLYKLSLIQIFHSPEIYMS